MPVSTAAARLRPAVAALGRRHGAAAVHRVRTAARRLDALLRVHADEGGSAVAAARTRLQDLRHRLGAIRDIDEIGARLQAETSALALAARRDFRPLLDAARREQQARRRELLRWLQSPAAQAFDAQLRRLAAGELAAAAPARLDAVLEHWLRRARRIALGLRGDTPLDEYHHLRRVTRRLLDLLHELERAAPAAARSAIDALQPLRAELGRLQDARVARAWLQRQVKGRLAPAAAFLAGRLSVALEQECHDACRRARKARARLGSRQLRGAVRALRGQARFSARM